MVDQYNLFHLLHQTTRSFSKSFNEKIAPTGLYMAQWTVIYYLIQNGPSSQITMSSYLNLEAPTMTRTLNRLEELGFIVRKEGKDRREKIIHLTELAIEKVPEWEQQVMEFEQPLFEQLTEEEMEMTRNVLNKINHIIQNK
ncbi:MAG: MarR family winged helix-turn-helix transcriptional regulator [Bacillus sp. (in: firmicutes)]